MAVKFRASDHKYESTLEGDNINWLSVTSVISHFKQPFDPIATSEKVARNKKSKWYGMAPAVIREIWNNESKRAVDLGTFYHNQREADLNEFSSLTRDGVIVPVIKPIYDGEIKLAPEQKLLPGIYPEHFVYLRSAGICGQADRVEVIDQYVDIYDYKTNKEIKMEGFKSYDGRTQKMLPPLSHLDDCSFNHYAIQMSTYMYMIIKHNYNLRPRKMMIHHIIFEDAGTDEYGYPITKLNDQGQPIVKEVVEIEVPYLKKEVIALINYIHDNRDKMKKK